MVLLRKTLYVVFAAMLLASCANRGIGPQGGPKDSIPPVPLKSEPEIGVLEWKGKCIEVTFDEYIQLDNIAANMMMSPPQQNPPDVKARGKRLIIQFQDSLRDSTTYTIDFGDAVCDFHEKVPLHGYTFYFSTWSEIDTLETMGFVYDAETLNPLSGITVGIHTDQSDTAFVKHPFTRIAKTDSVGFFRIGNVHAGTYRLYAVEDISRDYRLTVGEALAFTQEPISVCPVVRDTTDTVPYVGPLSTLFLFKEQQQKLYLQRTLRDEQHRVVLLFSSAPDSLPSIRPLIDTLHHHVQYSTKGDTVTIWLTDSTSIGIDSLFFAARYRQTDSLNHLEWCTDTLRAIWRAPKMTAKMQEAQDRKNRNRRLELKCNARKGFEVYDTLQLVCTTPLRDIDTTAIAIYERVDTTRKSVRFTFAPYDSLTMHLRFIAPLEPTKEYELHLDSGALHDVYGITHVDANYALQVKANSDYATLNVKITPFDPKARIQVLNNKDKVLRELPASEEGAFFEYLKADTYYLRLYIDSDGDGKWTTGSWEEHRQPEEVYYFPGKVQTKSNWDFEEVWDYTAKPRMEAKPKELIKTSSKKK